MIRYCTDIGFIRDFECDLETGLEWDNGEPILIIDDVLVEGHSLLRSEDSLMQSLAYRIADAAENDDALLDEVLDIDGISWTGRGPNDPDGAWRVAS